MDNLTHSLVGAVLGQTGLKQKTGLAMPALIIGANLPDVDAACFFWLEGTEHLGFRRGITHGPPAMVLLPLILAGLLWGFDRWQTKRGKRPEARLPVHFGWLYALSLIGCLTHPALDWLNVYGVRFLEPFSSQWFYGDTLFIIDVWLWALLGFAVVWGWLRDKNGKDQRLIAKSALALSLVYIALNGLITGSKEARDSDVIGELVIASPAPIWSWQREMIIGSDGRYRIFHPDIEALDPASATDEHYARLTQIIGDCAIEPALAGAKGNSQAEAFVFWTRAPFAVKAEDGSVILYDARFYDPRARDRFTIALPDVKCEELHK